MKFRTLAACAATLFVASPAFAITEFPTQQKAQEHCPDDTVVWLNLATHIYYMPGTPSYGTTRTGVFVCEKQADKEGDQPAKSGQ
jgi:hypothetical protein